MVHASVPPSHVDWVPPESFDEYRLVKALGRGSMGQVWLAHDTVLDRLVSVKFIAGVPENAAVRQRFLTEARAAARVQHPNIIAVYRVGEIGPRPYLISEYVRGTSLDKIARPVAWPRLLEIAIGLARGLAAAHRHGVLHRDLKPANAIVSETGAVKLLDFGLAKLLPQIAPPHLDTRASRDATAPVPSIPGDSTIAPPARSESFGPRREERPTAIELPGVPARVSDGSIAPPAAAIDPWPELTRAGTMIGTPAYMPPEAWRGEPATPRSDVYSLGALLYELCAGTPPHRGESPEAMRASVLDTDAPPLASAAPGLDPRFDPRFAAIVERCLRRVPAERFASGDAVREALEALAAGGQGAASLGARPPHDGSPRRRWWAVLAGAMLALALFSSTRFGEEHAPPPTDAAPAAEAWPDAPAQRPAPPPALGVASPQGGAAAASCPGGMLPVPAETFLMGSPDEAGNPDEHPQHEVTLSAYCIDQTEVTVAAYAACVAAKACRAAPLTVNWTNYPAANVAWSSQRCNGNDRPDHPINCIDWDQAAAYCAWQGKRLPTEAEWEYAARGNDGRVYPWGKEAPSEKRLNGCGSECWSKEEAKHDMMSWKAMYDGNDGWKTSAPVGSFPEGTSPFGALDMAGNVWEWTADWYGPYAEQAEHNPQGPRTGTSRVFRGGGWASQSASKARTANRGWTSPMTRDCDLGFRCVRGE